MSTRWIVLAATFAALAAIPVTTVLASSIQCPEPPAQTAKDVSVDTKGAVARLGKLKAGELANQTHIITKPLFDNVPNSDRFLVAQSLISLFCKTISASSLPDKEKMDRVQAYTDQIMSLWLGQGAKVTTPAGLGGSERIPKEHGATRLANLSRAPVPAHKPSSELEKYIDPTVHLSSDKKNVAMSVLDYAGADVRLLEGAAQRALRDRGYNVLPLFRPDFTRDEIGRTLFTGNSAVAQRLELRKHCDTVLLARLRLAGPVSNINGLYITEWALAIRAISPDTGSVTDEVEVQEKGGGTTAEASKADALRKLAQSVELQLTQWSWTS